MDRDPPEEELGGVHWEKEKEKGNHACPWRVPSGLKEILKGNYIRIGEKRS